LGEIKGRIKINLGRGGRKIEDRNGFGDQFWDEVFERKKTTGTGMRCDELMIF